jgi:hypothetical protein
MNQSATNIIDDLRLLEAPGPLPPWFWLVAAVCVAGLVYYLTWRRRHPAEAAARAAAEAQQAYEDALAELERVHKHLSRENCRPYAIEVSGIVRRYIERRFDIRAPRRSTEEFLAEARRARELPEKYQDKLAHFLQCCDFLKFAKGFADVDELELLHKAAVIFVAETQLQAAAPTSTGAQPEGRP